MDPRLPQFIYASFRASRDIDRSARARYSFKNFTKLCRSSSVIFRHFGSCPSRQFKRDIQQADRHTACRNQIVSTCQASELHEHRNIRLNSSRPLLLPPTGPGASRTASSNSTLYTSVHPHTPHPYVSFRFQHAAKRSASTIHAGATAGDTTGYEGVNEPSDITHSKYNQLADDYLEAVQQVLEDLSDTDESVEVEFSAGVLTVIFPPAGTYVINKQPPNKQIWLSSPVSGPKRYDYVSLNKDGANGDWVYLRDGSTMTNLLREEMGITLPQKE